MQVPLEFLFVYIDVFTVVFFCFKAFCLYAIYFLEERKN